MDKMVIMNISNPKSNPMLEAALIRKLAMKSLTSCASNPTLNLSSSRFPQIIKFPSFIINPTTTPKKLNYPLITLKPHAYDNNNNAKGFSSDKKPNNKKKDVVVDDDDDDEITKEVLNRIIVRILVSVGAPMGLGLGFLYVFGELKERAIWENMPMWVPFTTTLFTFGASTLGIAYGALSTSLDEEREGTFLGIEEAQRNWVEMWKEEDQSNNKF